MLFRFRAAQAADLGILDISRTRRPKLITSIDSIPTCEKWRGQVLKEISRKVSRIQDESLSDYQIRDLNDEINKLMREKHMWEVQIRNLGGPNYMRGGRMVDEDGKEIPGGGKGYRYVYSSPARLRRWLLFAMTGRADGCCLFAVGTLDEHANCRVSRSSSRRPRCRRSRSRYTMAQHARSYAATSMRHTTATTWTRKTARCWLTRDRRRKRRSETSCSSPTIWTWTCRRRRAGRVVVTETSGWNYPEMPEMA